MSSVSSFFGRIFTPPSKDAPPPPPLPPTRSDPAVADAAGKRRRAAASARGLGDTILTALGEVGSANPTKKALLG